VFHNPRVGWDVDFMKAPRAQADIGMENNAKGAWGYAGADLGKDSLK
jgi:hypothetical protein